MSKKQRYRIRNWRDYNEALVNRGSITFWFDEEAISQWHHSGKTKQRGLSVQVNLLFVFLKLLF